MTLGVDEVLAWTPAGCGEAAARLGEKSSEMEDAVRGLVAASTQGIEGQSGLFVARLRGDAEQLIKRLIDVAAILRDTAGALRTAGDELEARIRSLRELDAAIHDEGYSRDADACVRDTRDPHEDAPQQAARTARAEDLQRRLRDLMAEIREVDESANRALHDAVGRDVRDRTAAGNGAPVASGLTATSLASALTGAATELVEGRWAEAAREAGRGLMQVRGLGPAMAVLGFAGAVAARPEDEPLIEAVVAEGIGTMAASAGAPLGFLTGFALAGPPGAAGGTVFGAFGGGAVLGPLAAAHVRGRFDRAN